MTSFLQAKIAFAIGLLVLVLTIHPIINTFKDTGFIFLGLSFSLLRIYYAFAILLSLAVYFYAVSFLNETPKILPSKLGNIAYASAISIPPIYLGIYIIQEVVLLIFKIASFATKMVMTKALIELDREYFILSISAIFASLIFTTTFISIDQEDEYLENIDLSEENFSTMTRQRFISLAAFFAFLFIPIILKLFKLMI